MRGVRSVFLTSDPLVAPAAARFAALVRDEIDLAQADSYVLDVGAAASRIAAATRVSREQAAAALISAGIDACLNIEFPARLGFIGGHAAKDIEA